MVKEIKNAIPNDLCNKIIDTFKDQLVPAEIFYGLDSSHKIHNSRVALNYFFDEDKFPEILPLKEHISKITNIPTYQQEQFCLIRYDEGGKYDLHYDSVNPYLTGDSPRAYSFIFYLNDDYEGGETYFPSSENKTIKPQKGKMVYWNNFDNQQEYDYGKVHSGLPVLKGTKWILTLWVRDENVHSNKPFPYTPNLSSIYTPLSNENYGYTILKVPDPVLKYLKFKVDEIQKNNFDQTVDYRHKLEGEIKNEYELSLGNEIYTTFINAAINDFEQKSLYMSSRLYPDMPTELTPSPSTWVNFQKKGEYNPFHYHSGVYSYVIWYQIPYYYKDENYTSSKPTEIGKETTNGDFNFYFHNEKVPNSNPLQITRPLEKHVDKTFEGYMAVFPSNLPHSVFPFYSSDEFRITISGNIGLSLGTKMGQL